MSRFTVFPAIDLHEGQVVRLRQGDVRRQTIYHHDPAAVARRWLEAGARWIHVVNLDGAFENPDLANRSALEAILAIARKDFPHCRVQLGGGLRTLQSVQQALEAGVSRVVLGTAAVRSPEWVQQLLALYGPERVAVGLDTRGGKVMLRGWSEASDLDVQALAQRFAHMGLHTLIFTDITRDGMKTGINIAASQALADSTSLEVIASGGVRNLEDIRQAKAAGLAGVIIGRALYDGSVRLEEALEMQKEGREIC